MENTIVTKNLERMLYKKEGGMQYLLCNESVGGNAGEFNNNPCAGANFLFNKLTGEIRKFTNEDSSNEFLVGGIFRVVVNVDLGIQGDCPFQPIVYLFTDYQISKTARSNIEESVKRYNAEQCRSTAISTVQ